MANLQQLREAHANKSKEVRDLMASVDAKNWGKEHQDKYDAAINELESLKAQVDNHMRMVEADIASAANEAVAEVAAKHGRDSGSQAAAIYSKWLRGGDKALSAEDWTVVRNTMSTTTGAEGGYTVQTDVATSIIDALKQYGGMRQAGTVITTGSGNPMNWPTSDGTAETGEQLDENASATDLDVSFGMIPLNTYKYSSKVVPVPIELLQDSAIDLEAFINARLTKRIARITNAKFTNGTGTNEPKGLITASTAGKAGATGQTASITFEDLVDLIHSVDPAYRLLGGCQFMLNDDTMRVIRRLKDTAGRPIFIPGNDGLGSPMPDSILGYSVITNQDVPVMAASAKSVLFGKLADYTIRDVVGAQMFRFTDSAYAKKGQVGFLMMSRHGGAFADVGGAVKYYQNSAT